MPEPRNVLEEDLFPKLEALGYPRVVSQLNSNRAPWGEGKMDLVMGWVMLVDEEREAIKEARDERMALAADASAAAAKKSAMWAGLACIISLAALAMAAWPYTPLGK